MNDTPRVGDLVLVWWLNRDGTPGAGTVGQVQAVNTDNTLDVTPAYTRPGRMAVSGYMRVWPLNSPQATVDGRGWEPVPPNIRERTIDLRAQVNEACAQEEALGRAYIQAKAQHDRLNLINNVYHEVLFTMNNMGIKGEK